MNNRLTDFITAVEQENDFQTVWRLLNEFCAGFGVETMTYGTIRPQTGLDIYATCPEEWLARYCKDGYAELDPILARCLSTTVPFAWYDETAFSDLYERDDRMHWFYHTASENGYRRGMNVPVRSRGDDIKGGVTLCGDWSEQDTRTVLSENAETLIAASLYAHHWLEQARLHDNRTTYRITDRQRELLLWLTAGLQYDQAAHKMGIAVATIDFHMGELKRRLDVRTRREIVPKALRLGLIDP